MTRGLAIAVVLSASSALADDAPRRVSLEPAPVAVAAPAFDAAQHPVVAAVAISAAVVTVVAIVVGVVAATGGRPSRLQFPMLTGPDQPE